MNRRHFLSSTLAASALSLAAPAESFAQGTATGTPEFYELRRYHLDSGPQTKLTEAYFAEALIPAMNRLGVTPIGAFALDIGPDTPTYYLLLPSPSAETLVTADLHLAKDEAFMKAAGPFWSAPATAPAFIRIESTLLRAFPGFPTVTPPASAASKAKRIFQLRTYQSSTNADHVRKIEMMEDGEYAAFTRSGAANVFYADAVIGARLPALTYMLSFSDIDALNAAWDKFRVDPAWKKLTANPRYNYEAIVSNVDNLILRPLGCSQI
jgi:hypothetical protein